MLLTNRGTGRWRSPRPGAAHWLWIRCSPVFGLLLLVLPDGQLPGRLAGCRFAWGHVVGVGALGLVIAFALAPGPLDEVYPPTVVNPLGASPWGGIASVVAVLGAVCGAGDASCPSGLGVVSLIVRYRHPDAVARGSNCAGWRWVAPRAGIFTVLAGNDRVEKTPLYRAGHRETGSDLSDTRPVLHRDRRRHPPAPAVRHRPGPQPERSSTAIVAGFISLAYVGDRGWASAPSLVPAPPEASSRECAVDHGGRGHRLSPPCGIGLGVERTDGSTGNVRHRTNWLRDFGASARRDGVTRGTAAEHRPVGCGGRRGAGRRRYGSSLPDGRGRRRRLGCARDRPFRQGYLAAVVKGRSGDSWVGNHRRKTEARLPLHEHPGTATAGRPRPTILVGVGEPQLTTALEDQLRTGFRSGSASCARPGSDWWLRKIRNVVGSNGTSTTGLSNSWWPSLLGLRAIADQRAEYGVAPMVEAGP